MFDIDNIQVRKHTEKDNLPRGRERETKNNNSDKNNNNVQYDTTSQHTNMLANRQSHCETSAR